MSSSIPNAVDADSALTSLQVRTRDWFAGVKPSLDFVAAALLLLATWPILLVAAALVRLTSRGPAFYTQLRTGLGGEAFVLYKLRTMYADSERDGPRWCLPGDSRITPVGRLLRWTHIDELPQLVNVLRGEMSLVGPRPERPVIIRQLERALPNYSLRTSVRPGLTGLAQVQQGPDTDLESVRRKLEYDLYYIEHAGPWLDVRILAGTLLKCLSVPFPAIRFLLGFPGFETKSGAIGAVVFEASLESSESVA